MLAIRDVDPLCYVHSLSERTFFFPMMEQYWWTVTTGILRLIIDDWTGKRQVHAKNVVNCTRKSWNDTTEPWRSVEKIVSHRRRMQANTKTGNRRLHQSFHCSTSISFFLRRCRACVIEFRDSREKGIFTTWRDKKLNEIWRPVTS